jgi:hypothetical protein
MSSPIGSFGRCRCPAWSRATEPSSTSSTRLARTPCDIVDFTEETADFLGLYKIEAPMEHAQGMVHRRNRDRRPHPRGHRDQERMTQVPDRDFVASP